ncbi:MAG: xanthine dehydrogenase family protein molybdopterin-binding subunit [Pseudomonadota bacterium]|nr:xanthine dehydrogenase family protein molybdopterin-binding subunit [Pseudomonadota bacterium]
MGVIGQRLKRLEDRELLLGEGRFAADYTFADQLYMRVVRSPIAHGILGKIDTSDACAVEGVRAVWTGLEISNLPPIDFRLNKIQDMPLCRQHVLAQDKVRYVGDPIAVVIADDPYLAEDAAELVSADIEPLPPILDATAPPGEFAPEISTEPAVVEKSYGDLDATFANASHVFEFEFKVGRHTGNALETRGANVHYNVELDRLEFYGAAKVPHFNRVAIAEMLGLSLDRIHLFEGHVGGGFGVRGELYPEDVLCAYAALNLKRSVKWIEDRLENLMAANHSREQVFRLRAAVDDNGFILGIENEFFTSQGAYIRTHGATVTDLSAAMLPGPYLVPSYRTQGRVRLTNKTPCGTYRSPGRYESTFARERLVDLIAHRMGIDPIELRRRNLIPKDLMPYSRGIVNHGTPLVYDSGDYALLLDKLLDQIGYEDIVKQLEARRAKGEMVGIGIGYFVEKSGLGPYDDVRIEMTRDGAIEVVTGVASIGQGVETVIAQICADTVGVDYQTIRVTHGQTDRIERGMGAFASRVTVMTGSATADAAGQLRQRLVETAAERLQMPVGTLSITSSVIAGPEGSKGPSIHVSDAAAVYLDEYGGDVVTAAATFEATHMTYPYGIHLAIVSVDPKTAGVDIERIVVAYDIGRSVNPMLVEGQISGGMAQGIGGALYEEFLYTEEGQPISATFADYLWPTAQEVPEVEAIVTEDAPSGTNPLGLKGAGECGINASGAAIASAVGQAIGNPEAVTQLPITPLRLHEILKRQQ